MWDNPKLYVQDWMKTPDIKVTVKGTFYRKRHDRTIQTKYTIVTPRATRDDHDGYTHRSLRGSVRWTRFIPYP